MARRKSEVTEILSESERRDRINRGFAEIRSLMLRVADLKAEHIKPLADSITKEWRRLKAETGTERADLDPFFRLYMRDRMAEEADDAADAERIKANLRRVYQALALGETLDWMAALPDDAVVGHDEGPAAEAESASEAASSGGEKRDMAPDERIEAAKVAGPDADWGPETDVEPPEADKGDDGGFAYQAGERAGFEGRHLKDLLKEHGKHHLSTWAKSAKAGHAAGVKRRESEGSADKDPNFGAGFTAALGETAGYEGKGPEDNPNAIGSFAYHQWENGRLTGAARRKHEMGGERSAEVVSMPVAAVSPGLGESRPEFPAAE